MKQNKFFGILLIALMVAALGGCGSKNEQTSQADEVIENEKDITTVQPAEEENVETNIQEEIVEVSVVEPPVSDFTYQYDETLGGNIITGYSGEALDIQIPAMIDGVPVLGFGYNVFENQKVTSVIIPEGVISIGDGAFSGCRTLENISIPDTVTSIGQQAFQGTGLTSIVIPDSVTAIGHGAFASCEKLEKVVLSNNLVTLGGEAFAGCWALSDIAVPAGVSVIENYTFADCSSLSVFPISEGVTEIGECAFQHCSSLPENIVIPDSVELWYGSAFAGTNVTVTYLGDTYGEENFTLISIFGKFGE
uniref:leucine-rich repeat protein n=1 Tax=Acetatifactor sp. TaxID=1872090 RepID=UPI00405659A2